MSKLRLSIGLGLLLGLAGTFPAFAQDDSAARALHNWQGLEPFVTLNNDIGIVCQLARNPPRPLADDEEIVAESAHGLATVTKRYDTRRGISGFVLIIPLDDARRYWINQYVADFLRFKGQMLSEGAASNKDVEQFVQDGQREMAASGCWIELVTAYCQAVKDGTYLNSSGDPTSCAKH